MEQSVPPLATLPAQDIKTSQEEGSYSCGKNLYLCCAVVTCEGCMPDRIIRYPTVPAAQLSMSNNYEITPATS